MHKCSYHGIGDYFISSAQLNGAAGLIFLRKNIDLGGGWEEDETVLKTLRNPMLRVKGRGVLTSSVFSQPKLPRGDDEIDSN